MKNYFFPTVIVLFVFFSLSSFSQTLIGTWSVKENNPGYNLHTGSGERMTTYSVKFPKPFEKTPEVFLSVTEFDGNYSTNTRYNVEVMSVNKEGFKIKIRTWYDTKIFSIAGFWLAKGED
jgi:hypothetical protein